MSCASEPGDVMTSWQVNPDVRSAATLDAAFYRSEQAFAESLERVFARSWQWIGPLDDVAAPGHLSPRCLLPGGLDEPVLLSRDRAGTLRCLSNVCTHRGNLLVHEACAAGQIRCGYHARRFDLDGRMSFMPAFQQARDFPSPADDLPVVPFAEFHGHGFAAVRPAVPFEAVMAEVQARIGHLPIAAWRHDPTRDRSFEFDAHWALYVENYLEGLHIPFLHAGLMQTLDFGQYRHELGRYANLQLALAKPGEAAFELPASSPDHGQAVAAYYWWVFPNLMLNFYPWGLSLNQVQPLSPSRTRVVFRSYVGDASLLGRGAGGDLDRVELEDEAVVVQVQRGVRSRFYRGGRYSPTHEVGVHHFHRLIGEFMADGA
jgi:choline monooxygenase